jgi:indolepyruvate ferredoxin oxidoreductase
MDYALTDRYLHEEGTVYLTGVQALVRLLFDRARRDRARGLRTATFVSGYEGSPLAGYDLEVERRASLLADLDVVHQPGLNEELAATAVMGSQLAAQIGQFQPDGVAGVWYGKAPGLDRASDALRHANLVGTDPRGGAVALVGDDPGAKSSSVPCASEATLADLAIPTFYPADSQDVLDLGLHAHEMSRFTGLWSALKVATAVADGASTARVYRPGPGIPARPDPDGSPGHRPSARLLGPDLMALERSLHAIRLPRALDYARHHGVNRIIRRGSRDRIGIVAAGKTYLDLREALTVLGLDEDSLDRYGIRLLKLGLIWPLEPEIVREFATGLDELIVVEEKRSFLEAAVKDVLYGQAAAPVVKGKHGVGGHPLFSAAGELDADAVAAGLARALRPRELAPVEAWRQRPRRERLQLPLLARTPYFCSGCPHNSSTKVAEDTLVGAGIGCHAMVLFMPPEQAGQVVGLTQMGGEGAQWIGMAPFVGQRHFVQNLGDGTFWHSGSLAVRASVAAGVNVTYKLLYNSTVAMTGGQAPVGGMAQSPLALPRLARLLLAEGAAKVVITSDDPGRLRSAGLPRTVSVRDRDDLMAVQEELAAIPGVTVLIHDQECATEKRRKRRRGLAPPPAVKVAINERICEGCGDCGTKSNCLSVHPVPTEFGRKTMIDQSSCNADYSCLDGDCPSFVTVTPGPAHQRRLPAELTADQLPDPAPAAGDSETDGQFRVRITGIGGTGIVTVSQILATAAVIEGRQVRALDQTGLAQKGGAVVSDLSVTAGPVEQASKLGESRCDLYLGCDALVATDPAHLKAADPAHTVAVISTTEVPTGQMVVDPSVGFPAPSAVRSAVDSAAARACYLDAAAIAREALDDEQYANMVLVGAAFQTGAIPLDAGTIEQAIGLNGVAADANVQAFRRGRQAVARPAELRRALAPGQAPPPPAPSASAQRLAAGTGAAPGSELARLLAVRIADLTGYQNEAYAREYADFVGRVRAAEETVQPGHTAIAEAVAQSLFKLMAYKDEYEVARLALDSAFTDQIATTFGPGSRVSYRLHPPLLRSLGLRHKLTLGPWFRPAFRVLRGLRRLRGTPADLFGHTQLRRLERQLVADYRASMTDALGSLRPSRLDLVERIAALPDLIRGYEQVKLDNVARYRAELRSLQAELAALDQPVLTAPAA